jgi:hypothetical protein
MKMPVQYFGFILCSVFVLFLMLATQNYNGTVLVANDELKFTLIATGDIDFSPAHVLRMSGDFIGYYYVLSWIGSLGLSVEITGLILKLVSIIFHIFGIIWLKRAGFDNKIILLTALHPTLLFYAFSGVRDVIISAFCVFLAVLYIQRASVFWYALVAVLVALIRIEAIILPLAFFVLASSRFTKFLFGILALCALLFFLPQIALIFEDFVTRNRISGASEGILASLRGLPFPLDFLSLGIIGLAGTYTTPTTLGLEAAHEFVRQGVPFSNESFALFKILKFLGILVSNFLFPALVIFVFEAFRRQARGTANVFDQLLLIFSAILFAQNWIAIDLGKSSNYYYIIYAIVLTRIAAARPERQKVIVLLGLAMLGVMAGLFLLLI